MVTESCTDGDAVAETAVPVDAEWGDWGYWSTFLQSRRFPGISLVASGANPDSVLNKETCLHISVLVTSILDGSFSVCLGADFCE